MQQGGSRNPEAAQCRIRALGVNKGSRVQQVVVFPLSMEPFAVV